MYHALKHIRATCEIEMKQHIILSYLSHQEFACLMMMSRDHNVPQSITPQRMCCG
eukprot:m.23231 g.23231  ORF g.23231 m.23231 type:complete len:55 (+) comp8465_c0_seq4:816-980(+)